MFAVSVKTKGKGKWLAAAGVALLFFVAFAVGVSLHFSGQDWAQAADLKYQLSAPDAPGRIAFLSQFGWDVDEDPIEVSEVIIPGTFNDVYEQYNELQKQQGLDLSEYKGVTCKKWVYKVTNYPKPGESVRATLLIVDGKVIGGDISSVALDGFMHSFAESM